MLEQPLKAPLWGQYPIVASKTAGGWQAPGVPLAAGSERQLLGRGPVQFCGVFDTRPELEPWQPTVHRALEPVPSPGGVTLRWMAPRNTATDAAGAVQTLQPAFADAIALSLYVAGMDVVPASDQWTNGAGAASWPGRPVGTLPFAFSKGAALNLGTAWQTGLSFTRPTQQGQAGVAGNSGQFGLVEQQDGFRWMRNVNAMPVLDLLAYAGAPWSEADLLELAGGTRYVAAWLRLWWSRREGVDPLAAARYFVPWTVGPGRAVAAQHREAWHCSYPMLGPPVAAQADVFDDGVRYQVSSPIPGAWRVGVESNGDAGDDDIYVGLELRNGTILNRASLAVGPTDHGLFIGPTTPHAGAGVLSCGYSNVAQVTAGLVSVSVVRA